MIIECENCSKKFEVDDDLIPNKGRLLQCMKCEHTWFFKHVISSDPDKSEGFKSPTLMEDTTTIEETPAIVDKPVPEKDNLIFENDLNNQKLNNVKEVESKNFNKTDTVKKKGISFLNLILVFIISFIALIIVSDTFKSLISNIVPNIDILLYNLYESIKDIILFFNDLI